MIQEGHVSLWKRVEGTHLSKVVNLHVHFARVELFKDCALRFWFSKRDDFDFEIVNFPFLDDDVPRSTPYGVYISQLIRFARASSYVADFNSRNKLLTQKLLKQGYRYHKLRKTFSTFYRWYYDLISKFQVGLKSLLQKEFWSLISMVTWCFIEEDCWFW